MCVGKGTAVRDFHKQKVWQKAHELALATYSATRKFPTNELLGLTNQIRWSSTSIAVSIVQGCSRSDDDEYSKHLQSATASVNELDYYLLLARDLGFLEASAFDTLMIDLDDIRGQLDALIQRYSTERAAKRTNFPF